MRGGDSSGTSRETTAEQIASVASYPIGKNTLHNKSVKNLNFSNGLQE